jgi:hypothetical protein
VCCQFHQLFPAHRSALGLRLGFIDYRLPHPDRPLLRQRPLLEAGAQIIAVIRSLTRFNWARLWRCLPPKLLLLMLRMPCLCGLTLGMCLLCGLTLGMRHLCSSTLQMRLAQPRRLCICRIVNDCHAQFDLATYLQPLVGWPFFR